MIINNGTCINYWSNNYVCISLHLKLLALSLQILIIVLTTSFTTLCMCVIRHLIRQYAFTTTLDWKRMSGWCRECAQKIGVSDRWWVLKDVGKPLTHLKWCGLDLLEWCCGLKVIILYTVPPESSIRVLRIITYAFILCTGTTWILWCRHGKA